MRKKVTIRGVDVEAWNVLKQMRYDEQRLIGAIVSEAILDYRERYHGGEEADGFEVSGRQ